MSDFQNAVIKLLSSSHYKELATYEPPFNPFEIVGATHRELIHSSVLAWLLRDETNKEFRQRFVDKIATDKPELELSVPNDPGDPRLKPKIVETEKGDKASRYDVSVYFEALKLVIGIEVKVWAREQHNQVKRYQDLLCQNYPGYKKVVVFLTPRGRKPEMADKNNVDVPVLAMSWGYVSKMVRAMRSASGDENSFRMQFSQHLERNIVMNVTEEQRIVRELLSEGDNAETLDKIIKNLPSLRRHSAQWKRIVAEVCGVEEGSLEEKTYSEGGMVKELKIWVPEWHKAGLPFTVMLYEYQNAGVRILLFKNDYPNAEAELKEFANRSNGVVNDKFPCWKGHWGKWWRSVLTKDETDEEPEHNLIDDIWSEDWEDKAKKRLREQIEDSGLLDQINEWIKTKDANKG